jgi:DNA polymerase-1
MPDELAQQIEPLKKLLSAFNIGILELDGYEADDIIGTISKKYEAPDMEVLIYTGDRDSLQLVSDYTRVMFTKKGITEIDIYDKAAIKAKYGFSPDGVIDLKGLMGDASDNIPGVAGVGEKTALKLLSEYGTLEEVYENLDKITGKKLNENLELHKGEAFLSKRLATIDRNVPIDIDIESTAFDQYDPKLVREIFEKFEFRSLIDKLKNSNEETLDKIQLPDIKPFNGDKTVIQDIINNKTFNFIMEFNGKELDKFIINENYSVAEESIMDFKNVFESEVILKNTLEAKQVYNYLRSKGIEMAGLDFDFEIASYL